MIGRDQYFDGDKFSYSVYISKVHDIKALEKTTIEFVKENGFVSQVLEVRSTMEILDGEVVISFIVPDAVKKWQFNPFRKMDGFFRAESILSFKPGSVYAPEQKMLSLPFDISIKAEVSINEYLEWMVGQL